MAPKPTKPRATKEKGKRIESEDDFEDNQAGIQTPLKSTQQTLPTPVSKSSSSEPKGTCLFNNSDR
jgi:hypothetical protein